MSFIDFIQESKEINPTKLDARTLVELFKNNGIEQEVKHIKFVKLVKHDPQTHQFFFLVAAYDDNEDQWMASDVYVFLGKNGKICADFGGSSRYESEWINDVIFWIKKYKG
jgi:hypothetical protein